MDDYFNRWEFDCQIFLRGVKLCLLIEKYVIQSSGNGRQNETASVARQLKRLCPCLVERESGCLFLKSTFKDYDTEYLGF